jgi:hypothetical protein
VAGKWPVRTQYDMTLSDVYAALAYYFDHQEDIDMRLVNSQEFMEAMRKPTPSKLRAKLRK